MEACYARSSAAVAVDRRGRPSMRDRQRRLPSRASSPPWGCPSGRLALTPCAMARRPGPPSQTWPTCRCRPRAADRSPAAAARPARTRTLSRDASSAYVLRFWDSPPWSEPARAEPFIAACRQMAEEGTPGAAGHGPRFRRAFIGWCSLTRWNPGYRSASMGDCLDGAAWGHGYATGPRAPCCGGAFDTLDLNRVQAETDTRNVASARVLEKLGSCAKGRCGKTPSSTARSRTRGSTACSRRQWRPPPGPADQLRRRRRRRGARSPRGS